MSDAWSVVSTDRGYLLTWKGELWPMEPRATEQECRAYLERVQNRYRGDSSEVLLAAEEQQNGRQRGGPWRWTTPEDATTAEEYGTTGVLHTSRLQDAKKQLRAKMDRQRLPNGIEWELEQ